MTYVEALLNSWQLALKVIGYAIIVAFLFAIGGGGGIITSALIAFFVGLSYGYYVPDGTGDKTWWLGVFVSLLLGFIGDIVAQTAFGGSAMWMLFLVWLIFGSIGGWAAIQQRTSKKIADEAIEKKEMLSMYDRPDVESASQRGNIFPFMDIIGGLFLILFTPIIMTGHVNNLFAMTVLWAIFAVGGAWLIFSGVMELREVWSVEQGETAEGTVVGSWTTTDDRGTLYYIAYEHAGNKLFQEVEAKQYTALTPGDTVQINHASHNPMVARLAWS